MSGVEQYISLKKRPAAEDPPLLGGRSVGSGVPVRLFTRLALYVNLVLRPALPNVDRFFRRRANRRPQIMGARGPLSAAQSRKVLGRAGINGAALTALQRHLVIEQEVAETPLVSGNRNRLLQDGEETFRAMFTAMDEAKDHINLEYYILEDVESDGVMLSDLLTRKAQEGVAIHVIYDSFGSSSTPDDFFLKLRGAGISLLPFNPVNPLKARQSYKPNDRDHRKILIADGRIGIVGGINLSKTYLSAGPSRVGKSGAGGGGEVTNAVTGEAAPQKTRAHTTDYWRDTDLEIVGPVVAQLQRLFLEQWQAQHAPPPQPANFFPTVGDEGTEIVRIIGSTPSRQAPRYYITLLSAIRNADHHIFVMAAYFVPTRTEKRDLIRAARRGVDVRLLLPGRSDSRLTLAAQRSHYGAFLRAGVKVFEVHEHIQHTKAITVDGVWTIVGSSNLDHRSILFNDEVDAVVLGKSTAEGLERRFLAELPAAQQIHRATWRKRPWSDRIVERFARFVESLL